MKATPCPPTDGPELRTIESAITVSEAGRGPIDVSSEIVM
jgi:hypothetical protein